jgi:CRP-like cAMP-binding protein
MVCSVATTKNTLDWRRTGAALYSEAVGDREQGGGTMSGAQALAKVPLLVGLPPDELERLGACVRPRRYGRGEVIFVRGDPGNSLCVIESGRVKIVLTAEDGREFVLNVYGPGEFFGEFALLDGEPRSADAVAQEKCLVHWLRRDDFLRVLMDHPATAVSLLGVLSRRLRHTTRIVQDAAFLPAQARLARTILDLAAVRGRPASEGVVVESPLTQGELAAMIGTARETVNKCLRDYERRGLLRHAGGMITVLRPEDLRACAGDA